MEGVRGTGLSRPEKLGFGSPDVFLRKGEPKRLLISWGGFKQTVEKERASQFFRVRLWTRNDLIENLRAHYDALDEDIRSVLPLKRIWTIANQGED